MEEKLTHQSELFKLGLGLDERGIEYDLCTIAEGLAIVVPSQGWDAVCHKYSYGGTSGLLEVMGHFLVPDSEDGVEGWLTAKDILDRIDEKISEKKDEVNE